MKKTKIIKNLILISFYYLFLIGLVALLYFKEKDIDIQDEKILFRVENIKNPEQIFCHEEDIFVKKDLALKNLDFEERVFKNFSQMNENEIVSSYKDEIVFVAFYNHIITNPEEYATKIEILNLKREKIYENNFHQTIKPLYIQDNFLFLIDNYLNSPERTYKLNLQNGEIEFFTIDNKLKIKGLENIEILDAKDNILLTIPKVNDIMSFCTNEKLDRVALLDIQGNIWIYFKKSK